MAAIKELPREPTVPPRSGFVGTFLLAGCLTLRCSLKGTQGEKALGEVGGVAVLNESEWAMTGRSVEVKPDDRRPEIGPGNQLVRPVEDQVIARLDARANEPHPLQRQDFPFRVSINVKSQARKPLFFGNDCFVMLRNEEEYEIWIENRARQTIAMRLLVDGLNTLPEKETDSKGIAAYVIGKPVSLNEARHWASIPMRRTPSLTACPHTVSKGSSRKRVSKGK